jgi:hypothetical protein
MRQFPSAPIVNVATVRLKREWITIPFSLLILLRHNAILIALFKELQNKSLCIERCERNYDKILLPFALW